MRHFTITSATAALIIGAGSLWSVAAQADSYVGPITRAGQCWHSSYGVGAAGLGYWGDCQRDAPSLFRSERSIHSDTQKGKNPYPASKGSGY